MRDQEEKFIPSIYGDCVLFFCSGSFVLFWLVLAPGRAKRRKPNAVLRLDEFFFNRGRMFALGLVFFWTRKIKWKERNMDIDKEFKLSVLTLTVCIFLLAGLFLSLWWRPPTGVENSYISLGAAIFFLALGIASLIFLKCIKWIIKAGYGKGKKPIS